LPREPSIIIYRNSQGWDLLIAKEQG